MVDVMIKKDTAKPVAEVKEKHIEEKESQKQSLEVKTEEKAVMPKSVAKTQDKANTSDIVKKIVELHNDGLTASKIGIILRDELKVKNVKKSTGKTILQILEDQKLAPEIPEDLSILLTNSVKLMKHMKTNKKDTSAKRGYQKTVSKIRRLAKYYKRTNKLPKNWNYTDDTAAMLVK